MRIVYLGSGDIGLPLFEALLARKADQLVAAVTQPDRPAGRHLALQPPAIKTLAQRHGVPVFQPERVRRRAAVEVLRELAADLFVVFAYGQILPPAVLALPRLACLNVHASLLPRHRGAAPIQAAVAAGDRETGLTIMYMDAGMDTGDVLSREVVAVRRRETGGSLHDRLAALAPAACGRALDLLAAGRAPRQPQDHAAATYAPKLDRESGRIDWTRDRATLDRQIRAMTPWPGASTRWPVAGGGGEVRPLTLKIFSALPVRRCAGRPGEVVGVSKRGIWVAAGGPAGGGLLLRSVQLEGKRRLPAAEFARGYPVAPGTLLGSFPAG